MRRKLAALIIAAAGCWHIPDVSATFAIFQATNNNKSVVNTCPQGTSQPDGCSAAPTGAPQHPTYLDLNRVAHAGTAGVGSGYSNGTGYAWTGNGCSVNPTGTVDVVSGSLTNVIVLTEGSGCSTAGAMSIAIPAGAGGGTGGRIEGLVIAARPSWNVAGVDYAVGPRSTPTLDPASISGITGVSISTATCAVTISGNNVTLSGYDFTKTSCTGGQGWWLDIFGTGTVLTDFIAQKPGATVHGPIVFETGAAATIQYCTIDGLGENNPSGSNSDNDIIHNVNNGATVIKYCWLKNSFGDTVGSTIAASGMTMQFNLFENAKFCCNTSAGGPHGEYLDAAVGTPNTTITYNTTIQDYADANGWPGFLSSVWENAATASNGNISGIIESNTTSLLYGTAGHMSSSGFPSLPATDVWSDLHNGTPSTSQTLSPTVQSNYVNMGAVGNPTGGTGNMLTCDASVVTPTVSGNIDMETGSKPVHQGATPCN